MQPDLAAFLNQHVPRSTALVEWADGAMPLDVTSYASDTLPPLAYVTSVRSLVLRDGLVLVMRNPDGTHIWPGGRREAGETLEQTVQRELREEAGWEIDQIVRLGFVLYHHRNPAPPDYPWPYPDFVQLVCVARAVRPVPGARLCDDFELEARWLPVAEAQRLSLSRAEHLFLTLALTGNTAHEEDPSIHHRS